jgi:1-acyl-sn-glycerol-3-phosphate acyltransferase
MSRWLGRFTMRVSGWCISGALPNLSKFVIVVAPHTSNWDFIFGAAAKLALGLEASWIGKHTLFRWPLSPILRKLDGFPVRRGAAGAIVTQVVDEFAARTRMVFALAPEGTRTPVEKWHSGYWHIAHQAAVPIVPVGLDYATRTVVIGPPLKTTDSLTDDERTLRGFFASVRPARPGNYIA